MILTANIGSASKKYSLFKDAKEILSAHFEREGKNLVVTWNRDGTLLKESVSPEQYEQAAHLVIEHLHNPSVIARSTGDEAIQGMDRHGVPRDDREKQGTLAAIGIRVVAPGAYFQTHQRITDEFVARMEAAQEFAPLHISATLAEIKTLRDLFPATPMIAASDSAFHSTLPEVASTYALPKEFVEKFELRRFGYHGLSLTSIVEKLKSADGSLPERVIVCHLGSGSSVTALKNGKSVETSMGFSPLEGLVSSTRSGSIDPSIVVLLAEKSGLATHELEKKLNSESGLLAVGGSGDIRELLKMEKKGDANAKLALDIFCHRVRKYIGAYTATLGGVDAIVFTGTIGERSAVVRERILTGLEFLKVKLATRTNNKLLGGVDGEIQKPSSKVSLYVLRTNEAASLYDAANSLL